MMRNYTLSIFVKITLLAPLTHFSLCLTYTILVNDVAWKGPVEIIDLEAFERVAKFARMQPAQQVSY